MKTKKVRIPAYDDKIMGHAQMDISIQCLACNHFNNNMITCKAFPKGIPLKILMGEFDHTLPFKGDNEIQFERLE